MAELTNFLLDDYKDSMDYAARLNKGGLSAFPPLIITCAITGGNAGKEINMNLSESSKEQAEQTYDAYKAGASTVHVHRRDPSNPAAMTDNPEHYKEINAMIREKCPDLIINNTAQCGRLRDNNDKTGPRLLTSIYARPEVASIDITNYSARMKLPKRNPPLFGRDKDVINELNYSITWDDTVHAITLMKEYGVKPEFELFDTGDIWYLHQLIAAGLTAGPNLVQMIFTQGANFPTTDYLMNTVRCMPKNTLLGIIGVGTVQFPVLIMAIIQGLHVRVGMEDNIYIEKGKLAENNAQLVEKIVRIAKELGRPIATPSQARQMLGLGAPRGY